MTNVRFGMAENGESNLITKEQDVRYAMFKPELKYIIAPLADWLELTNNLQKSYPEIKC